jgi:hypothetical protein
MDNLENTYQWLQVSEHALSQHALAIYIQQMRLAVDASNTALALTYMAELNATAGMIADALDQAYVHLECARANFVLDRSDEAMLEIETAINLLQARAGYDSAFKHCNALAQWMRGNLLLEIPDQRSAAVAAWQTSLAAFSTLAAGPAEFRTAASGNPDWYNDRCSEMRQGIELVISTGVVTPPPVPASGTLPPPLTASTLPISTLPISTLPISTLFSGNINALPIVGLIPAGGFAPSGMDPYVLETLTLEPIQDEFLIGGDLHLLLNLLGSPGVTTLVSSTTYYILQVTGDSMNAAEIDSGDYVLLKQQSSADHMDIVAAEIVNVDTEATLKRYLRTNGMIILEPNSTNPTHQPLTFTDTALYFSIRGVAIGVFKKPA